MVVLGDSGPVWSPCTMTTGTVTTVTFLTVWTLVLEAIPTSMSCQYTRNRNMEFIYSLFCYDNTNGIYLTTKLKHFLVIYEVIVLTPEFIIAIATKTCIDS